VESVPELQSVMKAEKDSGRVPVLALQLGLVLEADLLQETESRS